jgi:predicted Ser/Thr protein kinase
MDEVKVADLPTPRAAPRSIEAIASPASWETVLIVSADGKDAESLAATVAEAGFRSALAGPDAAGLREATENHLALVFARIGRDDRSVLHFIEGLQRNLGSTAPPVLAVVTGDDACFERAYLYGARDVIASPVPPSLLRVKVARLARRRSRIGRIGSFVLRKILGRGGMGTVYLAERTGSSEPVALKAIDAGPGGADAESVARFHRECELLRSIAAPGVPRFFDAGRDGDVFYCVMEYVAGKPLTRVVEAGPLDAESIAQLLDELGETLDSLHAAGLVHRDVKPGNVILGEDGRAWLIDFGLAKRQLDHALTRADDVLGTVPYMAPEVIVGLPGGAPADAFALGMTALEAGLGACPIDGSHFSVAARYAKGQVPSARERLRGAPSWLISLIDALLVPEPGLRLSIAGMRERLARIRRST